jgi:hypothetical protein
MSQSLRSFPSSRKHGYLSGHQRSHISRSKESATKKQAQFDVFKPAMLMLPAM